MGNENIDQIGSFTYLSSIINKDDGSSGDVKSRIAKAQGVFAQLKKSLEESANHDKNLRRYSDDSGQI